MRVRTRLAHAPRARASRTRLARICPPLSAKLPVSGGIWAFLRCPELSIATLLLAARRGVDAEVSRFGGGRKLRCPLLSSTENEVSRNVGTLD
jgi:hypothetical protein